MKAYLLATAATLVLSAPALAAGQDQTTAAPAATQQSYQQPAMQGAQIAPSALSQDEVRQIQQALNDKGFDAGSVDGQWGPQTEQALNEFRSRENLSGASGLDQDTLSALGVNVAGMAAPADAETTGAATTGAGSVDADEPAAVAPADQPDGAITDPAPQQ